MAEVFNIALVAGEKSDDVLISVRSALKRVAIGEKIFHIFDNVFIFRSESSPIQLQELISPISKHFLVLDFNPSRIDGQLESEEWNVYTDHIFRDFLKPLIMFHGESEKIASELVNKWSAE